MEGIVDFEGPGCPLDGIGACKFGEETELDRANKSLASDINIMDKEQEVKVAAYTVPLSTASSPYRRGLVCGSPRALDQ